jgi:hypothetical protein
MLQVKVPAEQGNFSTRNGIFSIVGSMSALDDVGISNATAKTERFEFFAHEESNFVAAALGIS